jgi:hypothetical protein
MKGPIGLVTVLLGLFSLFALPSFAQVPIPKSATDSLQLPDSAPKANTSNDKPGWSRPAKAALYSAILPGAGQFYNQKYWKIPIVYALGGTIGYFIIDYNRQYNMYKKAYEYRTDSNPDTDAFTVDSKIDPVQFPDNPQGTQNLRNGRDFYRRNRDLNVIFAILTYGLQIADAHVDAHLRDFDVSDDLSLQVTPGLFQMPGAALTPTMGLTLTLDLNKK